MRPTARRSPSHSVTPLAALLVAVVTLTACADAPVGPQRSLASSAPSAQRTAVAPAAADPAPGAELTTERVIARLTIATQKYVDLKAAIDDGFVFLHGCEVRPGEGLVGTVYVHIGRLMDGVIDPRLPDGLIYDREPNGKMRLVGVELAVPYGLWTGQTPPKLADHTFQREDEFGVYALHAWIWRSNPNGMFEESNPRVRCLEEK